MKSSTRPEANEWLLLETELRDLAFSLERRGNPTAADVATSVAARIRELREQQVPPLSVAPGV